MAVAGDRRGRRLLRGIVDGVITAVSNVFQGLPGMVLMIAWWASWSGAPGASSGPGHHLVGGLSRLVRGEVMKVKSEMYVEGMRCLGAGHLRIVLRHVLPNIRTNVILQFTTRVGRVVLSVAGLSYLGLGIEPPTPRLGEMVSGTARRYFRSAPTLLWAPGICIILLTLSINLLGDLLRDRLDELRRRKNRKRRNRYADYYPGHRRHRGHVHCHLFDPRSPLPSL